ncbi:MAG TPA: alpha/beta hydrolase [Patescibacteria group bacterium]|nr:alpha/beta hydrolase [Patescibacteria group bacterium]
MQAVVDSLLTHYETEGKGKLVVLLHGWGDTAAGMKQLQSALAKRHTVIAVDLPGFGGTQAPSGVWGLDEYALFIAHFLQKIDAPAPAVLAGHSNGAAIAIRGLAQGVLQADKLVLLGAAGIRGTYKGRVKALRYITKFGKALTMPLPKSVKQKLRKQVYKSVGSDMLVAEGLQETFKKVVTDDVRKDAATLTQPALLIYGEQDDATPVWFGETYHQLINGSTLEILPGAGHFVHLDRPDDVNKLVQEFIA